MILHLSQSLPYLDMPLAGRDLASAYAAVLSYADSMETGGEACLVVDSGLRPVRAGFQYPPDEEEKERIGKALEDAPRPHDWSIEPGRYGFVQLSVVPESGEIERELNAYLLSHPVNPCCIRFVKENALTTVVQLLWLL